MVAEQLNDEPNLELVKCNYCGSDLTKLIYDFTPLKIVKCKRCRLVYTNPRLTLSRIKERLYNEIYWRDYEKALPNIQTFSRRWLAILANYVQKKQWKICEIGPGLGVFLAEAGKLGHDVFGIELSEYAINYAKANFDINTIYRGTVDSIDSLNIRKMDVFIMFATIEHLQDPLGTLKKVNNYLLDGGILLLSTGVFGCFNQIVAKKTWSIIAPEGHLYYFSKRMMKLFLEKAGFHQLMLETNGALINPLTKNRLLVFLFNNPLFGLLRIPHITRKLRLGDEMFVIARKLTHRGSCKVVYSDS